MIRDHSAQSLQKQTNENNENGVNIGANCICSIAIAECLLLVCVNVIPLF